jgi:hypothetical protein
MIREPKHIISTEIIMNSCAVLVGEAAEHPAADGPHQEAGGEHAGGVQQLHRGVVGGEKRRGKVDRAEGIDVEVEPFDEVAGRGTDNRENALAAFFAGVVTGRCCHVFFHSVGTVISLDILCNNHVPQADIYRGSPAPIL